MGQGGQTGRSNRRVEPDDSEQLEKNQALRGGRAMWRHDAERAAAAVARRAARNRRVAAAAALGRRYLPDLQATNSYK